MGIQELLDHFAKKREEAAKLNDTVFQQQKDRLAMMDPNRQGPPLPWMTPEESQWATGMVRGVAAATPVAFPLAEKFQSLKNLFQKGSPDIESTSENLITPDIKRFQETGEMSPRIVKAQEEGSAAQKQVDQSDVDKLRLLIQQELKKEQPISTSPDEKTTAIPDDVLEQILKYK